MFIPNRRFRRDYRRIFQKDPIAANMFLLLAELADERGQVITDDNELSILMGLRFDDPCAYSLERGA
jgi:hypothetical protein